MKRVIWINLVLGVWLIISPFVIGYFVPSASSTVAVANDGILGVLLVACSWWIVAAMAANVGVSAFQVLCGIWLIIAPFVLRYRELPVATVNDVAVGVLVLIVSAIETWRLARPPIRAA